MLHNIQNEAQKVTNLPWPGWWTSQRRSHHRRWWQKASADSAPPSRPSECPPFAWAAGSAPATPAEPASPSRPQLQQIQRVVMKPLRNNRVHCQKSNATVFLSCKCAVQWTDRRLRHFPSILGNRNEADHAVVIIPQQKHIEDALLSLMETCKNYKNELQLILKANWQLFETLHLWKLQIKQIKK